MGEVERIGMLVGGDFATPSKPVRMAGEKLVGETYFEINHLARFDVEFSL